MFMTRCTPAKHQFILPAEGSEFTEVTCLCGRVTEWHGVLLEIREKVAA